MKCWICGAPATTGEHKLKRSLIATINGRGPYQGSNEMSHVLEDGIRKLQGPDSDLIKYQNVLCAECNNERSQRFDRAYDDFFSFILTNEKEILARRIIDLASVYKTEWRQRQTYLYKYFVKLFGCDLAANGMPVPRDLVALLNQDYFLTKLRLHFAVNEDKLLIQNVPARSIGIGSLATTQRNLKSKTDPHYVWATYFSFLHVTYMYDWEAQDPIGATWTANTRYLYLGWIAPLTMEQREQLRAQQISAGDPQDVNI